MRTLIDTAFVTYLQSQGITVPVYPGFSTEDKAALCVVARATGAQMSDWPGGNFNVEFSVEVRGTATSDGYEELDEAVRLALSVDNLHEHLNLQTDYITFQGITEILRIEWDIEEDAWITRYQIGLQVAPR